MTKNIQVVDDRRNDYGATYPKRAKSLVKQGRARFIDEHAICLARPPIHLEEFYMNNTATAISDAPKDNGPRPAAPKTAEMPQGAPETAASGDADLREKIAVEYNNYAFPIVLESGMKDVIAYARRKDVVVESAFSLTLVGSGKVPPAQCPEAYSLSLRTVLFPIYPRLTMTQAGKVAKLIQTLP